jgi:mono/diheme cytochrome c family protein
MTRVAIGLVISLGFSVSALAQAPVEQGKVEQGKKVYADQKCSICHAIGGTGNKKGSLDGIGAKLSADETRQWITSAPEMAAKAKADRKPPMKAYTTLTKDEVDALVAYLQSLKK